jgi:hypothetical protein
VRGESRQAQLKQILSELEALQTNNKSTTSDLKTDSNRSECLKILASRIAVVRLLQAENRLQQQLLLGASSFLGGSVFMFLLKMFLDG